MKFPTFLLLASVLALATLSSAYQPDPIKPICFKKTIRCCYRFRPCGFVVRTVKERARCDKKVCKKVCTRVCKQVCEHKRVRVPKRICKYKYARVCERKEVERYGKWVWVKKCRWVRRHHCHTKFVYKTRRVCHKKCYPHCHPVCYWVHAICVRHRIFHYPKFCPRVHCGPTIFHGPHKVPAHVVSPKGKLIKVTHPKRTIIGKRRH